MESNWRQGIEYEEGSISLYWVLRVFFFSLLLLLVYEVYQTLASLFQSDDLDQLSNIENLWDNGFFLILLIALLIRLNLRLARIQYGWGGLVALRNGKKKRYKWHEVKSVFKLPFMTPPLYRIAFRDGDPPIYFSMSWWAGSIGIWSWDFTGFYHFAKAWIKSERKKFLQANKSSETNPDGSSNHSPR